MKKALLAVFIVISTSLFWSCDNNVLTPEPTGEDIVPGLDTSLIQGSGKFTFSSYAPLADKPIEVFYHVPSQANSLTPVLFVLHGSDRNGNSTRTALIEEANALNFIVIAPQFSDEFYPGGDIFNLGYVFIDGDNPTANSLNNEDVWTFSAIEPLFDLIKQRIGSEVSTYDILGFSAGAQFVHRFLIFKPQARINRAIAASSGWYTMLDKTITFPYGTAASPAENDNYSNLLAKEVYIVIGEADNDENSAGLRHNSIVDKQGLNRYDRAQHFYAEAQSLALAESTSFNWQYKSLPGVAHDYQATSAAAALLLYQ